MSDRLPKEFIVDRQGKSYVLYAGLLHLAHTEGLKAIRTTLLQVPSPENGQVAIVSAEVTTEKGTFTGIGDAAPDNLARVMVPHSIRMAETRSKARALRDAVDVGMTALEELGDLIEEPEEQLETKSKVAAKPTPIRANGNGHKPQASTTAAASEKQLGYAWNLAQQKGLNKAGFLDLVVGTYGCEPRGLTKAQASDLIEYLQGQADAEPTPADF